jgi:hypothetical protein
VVKRPLDERLDQTIAEPHAITRQACRRAGDRLQVGELVAEELAGGPPILAAEPPSRPWLGMVRPWKLW